MFDPQAIGRAFSAAASHYDANARLQQTVRARCLALARDVWPASSSILDIGSGTGRLLAEASDRQWNMVAADLAFGMCRLARADHGAVINANVETLPFAPGAFDGLFSSLMLQWVNDTDEAIREMFRVLRAGGQCILSTLLDGTLYELREAFTQADDLPHVSHFISARALQDAARQAGFLVRHLEEQAITEDYADFSSLVQGLRSIGAANKLGSRRKSLMTPIAFKRVEQAYIKNFGHEKGLPATWQVAYLVLGKSA